MHKELIEYHLRMIEKLEKLIEYHQREIRELRNQGNADTQSND